MKELPRRGGIARGLGRCYGDSAQNGGGVALRPARTRCTTSSSTTPPARPPCRPASASTSCCGSSCPRGCFVPVTPGTRFVTVGGAIASDIHGKNHHVDGSFGNHVRAALAAAGRRHRRRARRPTDEPELFWATVGGMGLTGVILEATFALLPIETSRCSVDTERAADLDALLDADGRAATASTATRSRGST